MSLLQHSYLPYDGKFFSDIKLYSQDTHHENIIPESLIYTVHVHARQSVSVKILSAKTS